jgi:hypothetical protein
MNGSSKRPPHGRFDGVGDDDATVRAQATLRHSSTSDQTRKEDS